MQAIVALTFAQYAAKPFFPECEPPDQAVRILAALCLCNMFVLLTIISSHGSINFYCIFISLSSFVFISLALLTAINCVSTKLSMKVQDIFTAAKLFALIGIILAGLYTMAIGKIETKTDL